MKTFITFLILIASTLLITTTQSQAQWREDQKVLVSNDSINDISGTDTTIYYIVNRNADWSLLVSTGTITGSGGVFQVVCSHDGSTWFNYPNKYQVIYNASDSTVYNKTYGQLYTDTIASNNRHVYYDNSFSYKYIGLKTTKGTCSGTYKAYYFSRKRE